jgi:hypothetical protein
MRIDVKKILEYEYKKKIPQQIIDFSKRRNWQASLNNLQFSIFINKHSNQSFDVELENFTGLTIFLLQKSSEKLEMRMKSVQETLHVYKKYKK